jgi:hypothetical protein
MSIKSVSLTPYRKSQRTHAAGHIITRDYGYHIVATKYVKQDHQRCAIQRHR